MNIVTLLEAPRDELGIHKIAESIVAWLEKELLVVEEERGRIFIPRDITKKLRLKDIVPKGNWGHLYPMFGATEFTCRAAFVQGNEDDRKQYGEYSLHMNAIHVNVRIDNNRKLLDRQDVVSTIVHEMRHRIDAVRSSKKAFKWDQEYTKQPHEINARFSEVIHKITKELQQSIESGNVMSVHEFVRLFEIAAAEFDLIEVFKDNPDSVTQNFMHFVKNGVFGRATSAKDAHLFARSMSKIPDGQPVGPMKDPAYRRLISRVVQMYNYIVDRIEK